MKTSYRTVARSLVLSLLCDVYLTSASTSNHTAALLQSNEITVDQNIANYLQHLSFQPASQFNQAKVVLVTFSAGGRAPYRVRSADINAHHRLSLAFRSGDFSPTLPPSHTYFHARNSFPQHWKQWSVPIFWDHPPTAWLGDRHEIDWAEVQALLPVARADALLKAAGYKGAYRLVYLHEMDTRPLQYCFEGLWPGPWVRNVVVEVRTGMVREVNHLCLFDATMGRPGDLSVL
ncbi:MAG: hypothetical protein Q9184_004751 [Pyrenodesmia sp. 2 TL-2023]